MDEYNDIDEASFTFRDVGMNSLDRDKFIDDVIRKKNEYLLSLGYTIDDNGKIIPPDTRMEDGIMGFAVGDALGVPVEFLSRSRLKNKPLSDMIGFGSHLVPEGSWSDDTSLMVATMSSIIDYNSIDYEDIMSRFYEWLEKGKYSSLNTVFDVGISTRKAILNYKNGIDPLFCGGVGEKDNGNGSLMRMLPIAYYFSKNDFSDDEEVEMVNNMSSLTHRHEISCLGCKIFVDYVKLLLEYSDKFKALEFVKKIDYSRYYSLDIVSKYDRILNDDVFKLSKDEIKSSGYVIDTLEASLWSFLNSDNYEYAVLKAINLGGDTDTIGAITGALSGIFYGKKQIPRRWLAKLKKREYLENISKEYVNSLNNEVKNRNR